MPARIASISFIFALSIFATGLSRDSAAQTRQSQAAFETAIRDSSTSPYVVLVTVVDGRTGQAGTGCTLAPFLLGAIYIEKWGSPLNKAAAEARPRLEEAVHVALTNTSHVFHFSNQAALDNILPLRYQEACSAIEKGSRARISHRTRRVILGPFVEGPGIISPCPAVANATKEAGSAISLLIGPDGKLKDIKVSGNSGPVRQKEEEIRSALSVCKFLPRTVDGDPAPEGVWMTIRQAYLPRPAESSAPGRR
jgi:hypothetical protein